MSQRRRAPRGERRLTSWETEARAAPADAADAATPPTAAAFAL